MSKLNYLNLGCGPKFHKDWVNVDMVSNSPHVLAHNLLEGVPYPDNTFDVVYHSHVLEHFPKDKAEGFIAECYRLLKPGGTIRIVLPDLESIAREYLRNMQDALEGKPGAAENYDWILLEMYDQTVRNNWGGEMSEYLQKDHLPNEEYVYKRIGATGRKIRHDALARKKNPVNATAPQKQNVFSLRYWKSKVFNKVVGKKNLDYLRVGHFRHGGEIHQWMYDRFSLGRLLKKHGFTDIKKVDAATSRIPGWTTFELDDATESSSLYMEAVKPAR